MTWDKTLALSRVSASWLAVLASGASGEGVSGNVSRWVIRPFFELIDDAGAADAVEPGREARFGIDGLLPFHEAKERLLHSIAGAVLAAAERVGILLEGFGVRFNSLEQLLAYRLGYWTGVHVLIFELNLPTPPATWIQLKYDQRDSFLENF